MGAYISESDHSHESTTLCHVGSVQPEQREERMDFEERRVLHQLEWSRVDTDRIQVYFTGQTLGFPLFPLVSIQIVVAIPVAVLAAEATEAEVRERAEHV